MERRTATSVGGPVIRQSATSVGGSSVKTNSNVCGRVECKDGQQRLLEGRVERRAANFMQLGQDYLAQKGLNIAFFY